MQEERVHIFLADDDTDERVLFHEAIRLNAIEAELSVAGNGSELLELLLSMPVNATRLVFLDLNMPIKNGYDCLREIRQHETLRTLPVIIYSTSNNQKDINDTFEAGADFYLHKPSSFNDLQSAMRKLIALQRKVHEKTTRENFVIAVK
ncbi:MAG: response regulator [Chitinophagales bacterium]|nr:response regulator [Chitinophagales bacterium]